MLTTSIRQLRKTTVSGYVISKLSTSTGENWGDKKEINLREITNHINIIDVFSCLKTLPKEKDGYLRLLACDIAENSLKYTPRVKGAVRETIEIARRYANNNACLKELQNAGKDLLKANSRHTMPALPAYFTTAEFMHDVITEVAFYADLCTCHAQKVFKNSQLDPVAYRKAQKPLRKEMEEIFKNWLDLFNHHQ